MNKKSTNPMVSNRQKKKRLVMRTFAMLFMDDVGGLYGYIEFLQTWKEGDREEARNVMEWAKGQGWTGKPSKPENLL